MRFTIPGEPVAKGRPRFTMSGRTYTPAKTTNYENLVKLEYERQSCDVDAIYYPPKTMLEIEINAYFTIPKSASKRDIELMKNKGMQPTKKPDADNIIKAICDALNGVAYKDDSQIVNVKCSKWYGETPRTEVEIKEVKNGK